MKTIGTLLEHASRSLLQAGLKNPRLDAECLLAKAMEVDRLKLYLSWNRPLSPSAEESFRHMLARRKAGEPLQYLLGYKEFWSLQLKVTPEVLIPRPETETLVEAALAIAGKNKDLKILDLGTGSGAIGLALAKELAAAQIFATDISACALQVAKENARLNGIKNKVTFLEGDLFQAVAGLGLEASFDIIISNPPYIPSCDIPNLSPEVRDYEPRLALEGGWDGLKFHRLILHQAPRYLSSGGWLLMEIGWNQGKAVNTLARAMNFYKAIKIIPDLQGLDRVVCLR